MPQFSKESLDFLRTAGEDPDRIISSIPNSANRMYPGVIIIFTYEAAIDPGNQRVVLIVGCDRGEGVFPGLTGTLVSCIKLDADSDTVIDIILENLYKKRRVANYYAKITGSLISLLGEDSFRTYKLNKMSDIYKVLLGD